MENHEPFIDMEIAEAGGNPQLSAYRILKQTFASPAKGTYRLFSNTYHNSISYGIIMMLAGSIVCGSVAYVLLIAPYEDNSFYTHGLRTMAMCLIFNVLVATLVLAANALAKKPNIAKAILSGGLCALTMGFFAIIMYLLSLVTQIKAQIADPLGTNTGSSIWLVFFLVLYLVLLLINIVMQALRAGNEKDGAGFYLSPIIVILAFYLSTEIISLL